jgi:two-component system sensor histidine kinase PilS (NtrC family)
VDDPKSDHPQLLGRANLLRWLYLGRLTLVTGILAGALLEWESAGSLVTQIATIMFLVALGVTAASFWYTHLLPREPGENFLYAQVVLDVFLVTGVVHVTNGPDSNFAPLYILVISSGALLLPLPGGVLIGGLASMVYFADLVWGYQSTFGLDVALQIGLFTMVAIATGLVGDRLRRAGMALGMVESELRQLRLDTSDILANLATGVLTVDGDGRMVYANQAAGRLLGFPLSDWLGRRVLEQLDDKAPGLGKLLQRSITERRPFDRRQSATRRGHEEVRLGVSTAVLERGEGETPSATAIFQDITDEERLDVLHRRAERMEAIAGLSASLAHEIKNPLASIRSAVEQLSRSNLGEEDRAVLEDLVLSESDRLSRLLSEFLEYSGVSIGARETVDVAAIVRDCSNLLQLHPDLGDVELVFSGTEEPVEVSGDADLLHRALFNLVHNSLQFAGPGGRVDVSVEAQPSGSRRPRTRIEAPVRLRVSDTGPGIAPDLVERIFEPFFTTREGGSGLGLAVVHRAVEAHDGAILVDRAPGGGAQFDIYLPGLTGSEEGAGS